MPVRTFKLQPFDRFLSNLQRTFRLIPSKKSKPDKIYTREEIDNAKQSPSFEREYNPKYLEKSVAAIDTGGKDLPNNTCLKDTILYKMNNICHLAYSISHRLHIHTKAFQVDNDNGELRWPRIPEECHKPYQARHNEDLVVLVIRTNRVLEIIRINSLSSTIHLN